jgi:hypothetical protein
VRGPTGAVIAGVSVWLENSAAPGAVTDSDGRYVLSNVAVGTLALRVARPGRPPVRFELRVPSGSYDLELSAD